ncbi:hypothetical protein RUND412_002856 [Rhizina undulata]
MPPKPLHRKIPISNNSGLSITLYLPSTYSQNPKSPPPLVVFVNGLLTEASDWAEVCTEIKKQHPSSPILTFDRWNRGASDPLPENYGANDISTAAADLSILLEETYKLLRKEPEHTAAAATARPKLVLVGSSIGCCIIRLFVENHCRGEKHKPAGVIFLDSYIANTDFTSLFPPPDPKEPRGLTDTRRIIGGKFHPSVPNPEGLSRENARELLPFADRPKFQAAVEAVVVVSHDPETNVEEMVARLGIDGECYLKYVESVWEGYNKGLQTLTERGRRMVARGSGHFIPKERPDLVVEVVGEIVEKVWGG